MSRRMRDLVRRRVPDNQKVQLRPMLVTSGPLRPDDDRYAFEVKWDGFRALVSITAKGVQITSRNGHDMTPRYPELQNLSIGSSPSVLLDGELVCLDDDGNPDFAALWFRSRGQTTPPVCFMAFDVLELDGTWQIDESYRERRKILEDLEIKSAHCCVPETHIGEGAALFAATKEMGLEGVVAKRLESRYRPGIRSRSWAKTKHFQTRTFALRGWLPPEEWRGDRGCVVLGLRSDDGMNDIAGEDCLAFDERGAVYVLFGSLAPGRVDVADAVEAGQAIAIRGGREHAAACAVSAAGDVNGDGMGDVLVGDSDANNNGLGSGSVYVVFGSKDPASIDLTSFDRGLHGTAGFRVDGPSDRAHLGESQNLAALGDMNSDGYDDILLGAPLRPAAYVIFGKRDPAPIDLVSFEVGAAPAIGYRVLTKEPRYSAFHVLDKAGDVNGDGVEDFIIGLCGGVRSAANRRRSLPEHS